MSFSFKDLSNLIAANLAINNYGLLNSFNIKQNFNYSSIIIELNITPYSNYMNFHSYISSLVKELLPIGIHFELNLVFNFIQMVPVLGLNGEINYQTHQSNFYSSYMSDLINLNLKKDEKPKEPKVELKLVIDNLD